MAQETITVEYAGIRFEVTGEFEEATQGTFSLQDGGTPDEPAIFDLETVYYNGQDFTQLLLDTVVDQLAHLALEKLS